MQDGKTMMTRSGGAVGAGVAGVADDANGTDEAVDADAAGCEDNGAKYHCWHLFWHLFWHLTYVASMAYDTFVTNKT